MSRFLCNASFEGGRSYNFSIPAASASDCSSYLNLVLGGHKYDIFEDVPAESSYDTTSTVGWLALIVLKEKDSSNGEVKRSHIINTILKPTLKEQDIITLLKGNSYGGLRVDDIYVNFKKVDLAI
jgi:hypothetical protein